MESPNNEEKDEPRASESPQESEHARGSGNGGPESGPKPIRTDDPLISSDPGSDSNARAQSSGTTVIETSRIRGPNEAFNPNFVMVPVETPQPRQARSGGGDDGNSKKEKSQSKKGQNDDENDSEEGHNKKHGRSSQAPSMTRILLYSGIVALICGMVGAFGYSYFFGSKSGDKSSSGNDSGSSKSSSSSKGSDSGGGSGSSSDSSSSNDSGSTKNSDTRRGSGSNSNSESGSNSNSSRKDKDSGKLAEAEKAWLAAVKELRQTKDEEKAARQSEQETKAILDFLKNTLLSAGRPGDASISNAFWSGGQGKDVTLHKALEMADSKVSESFADRPVAEAKVREVPGIGLPERGRSSGGRQAVRARIGSAGSHAGTDPPRNGRLPQSTGHRVPACPTPDRSGPSV